MIVIPGMTIIGAQGSGGGGTQGPPGPANTLTIGEVETLAPGEHATAVITGEAPNQTLSLGIPAGVPGEGGDPWADLSMTTATGGRQFGIPFTLSEEKPAMATYTFDTSIPNTAGGHVEITIYVGGAITAKERVAQPASSATGSTAQSRTMTVIVPKGAPVVISTSAASGATVSLYRRQEVVF